jgi:hypothetical protein
VRQPNQEINLAWNDFPLADRQRFPVQALGDVNAQAISATFADHSGWRKTPTIREQYIMKKHVLIMTMISAGLVGNVSAVEPSPTPMTCNRASWTPELYSLYGDKEAVAEKLAKIPATLSERRVFLQVTQGDSSADVKLFEREKDGTFTVTEWTAKKTSGLLADIDKAIVANKGVNCVGEQVKAILTKELKGGKVSKDVPAPASPEAAFAHPVKEATGAFIKTTVVILC